MARIPPPPPPKWLIRRDERKFAVEIASQWLKGEGHLSPEYFIECAEAIRKYVYEDSAEP